jgi:hypothetical protein
MLSMTITPHADLVEKTGQAGIPVIEIGKETIIGFDRPRIDLHYGQISLV